MALRRRRSPNGTLCPQPGVLLVLLYMIKDVSKISKGLLDFCFRTDIFARLFYSNLREAISPKDESLEFSFIALKNNILLAELLKITHGGAKTGRCTRSNLKKKNNLLPRNHFLSVCRRTRH